MKIIMLVSVSRSDGFSASIGQMLDVTAEQAQAFIADGWAVAAEQITVTPSQSSVPSSHIPLQSSRQSGIIDLADGVDSAEATLAGKTLAQRKKEK